MTLEESIETLNKAVAVMKRNTAMMKMRMPGHSYNGLVRVMVKLGLVKEWLDLNDLGKLNLTNT
jgi:hypothetical protein